VQCQKNAALRAAFFRNNKAALRAAWGNETHWLAARRATLRAPRSGFFRRFGVLFGWISSGFLVWPGSPEGGRHLIQQSNKVECCRGRNIADWQTGFIQRGTPGSYFEGGAAAPAGPPLASSRCTCRGASPPCCGCSGAQGSPPLNITRPRWFLTNVGRGDRHRSTMGGTCTARMLSPQAGGQMLRTARAKRPPKQTILFYRWIDGQLPRGMLCNGT